MIVIKLQSQWAMQCLAVTLHSQHAQQLLTDTESVIHCVVVSHSVSMTLTLCDSTVTSMCNDDLV